MAIDPDVKQVLQQMQTEIDELKALPVGGAMRPDRYIVHYPDGTSITFVLDTSA